MVPLSMQRYSDAGEQVPVTGCCADVRRWFCSPWRILAFLVHMLGDNHFLAEKSSANFSLSVQINEF
jgi:hypothetical protein